MMEMIDRDFEIDRPHNTGRLYKYLIDYKLNNIMRDIPFTMRNISVLDICCGSGMISEYYALRGADVTGVDLSQEAVGRARLRAEKYGFSAEFKVSDVTELDYPDNSYDIVSVHDGLHHIKEPKKAIKEMARVAKKAVLIIEPARSLLTRISVMLGISTDYEGEDYVYRFREKELKDILIASGYKHIKTRRYLMYYPHVPGKVFKIMEMPVIFTIIISLFYIINMLFGMYGNKIQVVATK